MPSYYSTDDALQAIQKSQTWSDVCRTLNITVCTFNFKRLQALAASHGADTSHFVKSTKGRFKPRYTAESALVEHSSVQRGSLNALLKRLGLYTGVCTECGVNDTWQGRPLTLEIDHINGICTDNRAKNLRWLCPNCHSQTDTYRSRYRCDVDS